MSNNSELVSIIIPSYNREYIIKACIDSVLQQTYQNIEVIVVDDCSSDRTVEVVQSMEDPRISCYPLPKNRGACYARNFGVSHAKGSLIAFQDSDDIWLSTKLDEQVKYLHQGDYDLVFCGMDRVTESKEHFYYPSDGFDETTNAFEQILFSNRISTQCILMKADVFNKVQFDETIRKYQDWDFAIRAAESFRLGYLAKPLVISEIQANSISAVVNRYDALKVIFEKYQTEISKYPLVEAHIYYRLAEESIKHSRRESLKWYILSLKSKFSIKTFIKLLMGIIGIRIIT